LLEIFWVARKELDWVADDGEVAKIGNGVDVVAESERQLYGLEPFHFRCAVQGPGVSPAQVPKPAAAISGVTFCAVVRRGSAPCFTSRRISSTSPFFAAR
jgi:hypothetical protein